MWWLYQIFYKWWYLNKWGKKGEKQLAKLKRQNIIMKEIIWHSTSHLSAYIKFGCLSIREVYWAIIDSLGKENKLIEQLFWREFYFYISYYFPQVLKGKNYNPKYDNIKWIKNNNFFLKWCNGETGYPVVDAGMRELKNRITIIG